MRIRAIRLEPKSPRTDRHPHGHVRRRSWHPAVGAAVRGLRGALGADPRRRAAAISTEPARGRSAAWPALKVRNGSLQMLWKRLAPTTCQEQVPYPQPAFLENPL